MNHRELRDVLADYPVHRTLPGNRWAAVAPLTFGRGRIVVGRIEDPGYIIDGW